MMQTAEALYDFFSAFGIPAYAESNEPDSASLPYITYELAEPHWTESTNIHARVWYRSTSFAEIFEKVDEIKEALGEGVSIPTPTGAVYLWPDTDFAQIQPMEGDPKLKCAFLSFVISAHTK